MRSARAITAIALASGIVLAGCSSTESGGEPEASEATQSTAESVETTEEPAEESVEDAVEEPVEEIEVADGDTPYFYGFGCQGAAETLLDMAAYFGEFDPAMASGDDADTFRALGEAMIETANLPEEGASGAGVTAADQYIYAAGISAIELADVIDDAGFTRDVEEFTSILGENATLAVQECGLD